MKLLATGSVDGLRYVATYTQAVDVVGGGYSSSLEVSDRGCILKLWDFILAGRNRGSVLKERKLIDVPRLRLFLATASG